MHLLIAEDAALSRRIIEHILTPKAGYEMTFAEDGEEAWKRLSDNPNRYDVVLLDLIMPRMGGFEVLERIRSRPDLKDKPVVRCTAVGRASRWSTSWSNRIAKRFCWKNYR